MSDIKIPTRPAPEPPHLKILMQKGSKHIPPTTSNDRDTCFERFKLSRSQSVGKLGETKKPPPRPPPPLKVVTGIKSASSSRQPSQLLYGLLGRSKGSSKVTKSHTSAVLSEQSDSGKRQAPQVDGGNRRQPQTPCGLLIDLNSPPASPTRSSSDGFSLNSFGSDGHNNASSQVESGFEDDFDSLLMSNSSTPIAADPWTIDTRSKQSQITPFELSNEDPRSKHKAVNVALAVSTKPTIIRAKSSKPARPPPPKLRPCSTPPSFVSAPLDPRADWSPPPPNIPPPPPPPEALAELESGPNLPPRPTSLGQEGAQMKKPYCIALYDYETGHPDDLIFKVNDVIHLTERVNNDWLRGTLNNSEGIFPANFVNIVVPLEEKNKNNYKYVIALYTFTPETWDDLAFQEGDTVKVLKRINDYWLFGECNGKQGQFPENYVTDVSSFFPLQDNYS